MAPDPRSYQNDSTLTNDPSGTPRPQHANSNLNGIPEGMEPVGANDLAEQRPPQGYHEVGALSNADVVTPAMQQNFPEGRQEAILYPPSVQRPASPDLGHQINSPMNMQDLRTTSRLTLSSNYAFRQPPTGGGSERPTHEEAAEAPGLNRITVILRKQIDDARRERILALQADLELLQAATPTRDGDDAPRQEEPDSSPDESGFPRYRDQVDIGSSLHGYETYASPDYRPYAPPPALMTIFPQPKLDVSRVPVDAIKRSSADEIRLSIFILQLLEPPRQCWPQVHLHLRRTGDHSEV